ncbi:MAG: glycoside hydrolase family 3 N-terminal domain-containing protein [Gordonia sp. (in: high G+C Gram-positive bacteria)]|uniref:glycoside hydrolase family 3 N-terminal domain-containing protein n=1 Tax=Gordonia sp. (in: high G+C Gram-positive bacteria) TaxID=84139 RepID=UPI003BB554D1
MRNSPRSARYLRPTARLIALVVCGSVVAACSSTADQIAASSSAPAGSSSTAASAASASTAVPAVCGAPELARLTLRQKLAQRLVVGVTGAADAKTVVQTEQIGGIFVGSWTDLTMLSDGSAAALAESADTPLMVTVDQEGGRVARLSKLGIDLPAPRAAVASGQTPGQVRAQAKKAGQQMAKLGITVDFAPVVDVSAESDDEVIGDRSYSSDAAVVTEYAGAFAAGLQDAGIMPVYKHFPGHGSASGDSHLGSVTTPPLAQLQRSDLVPYRTLLKNPGNAGVMVGHLMVPGLTQGDTPASISPAVMSMLRSGAGYDGPTFDGVIFSDDLSGMKAITDRYPIDQAVLRAFQAGSDIGLWLTTDKVSAVLNTLERAVADGKLPEDEVDASVVRILRAKGVLSC